MRSNFSVNNVSTNSIPPFGIDTIDVTFHPVKKDLINENLIIESPDFYGTPQSQIVLKGEAGVISGRVSGVWGIDDSPYILSGSVRVDDYSTLTIKPGVEVFFKRVQDLT
jgi:hypothetical protein